VNVGLNKQSRIADKGLSSSLSVGQGLTSSRRRNSLLRNVTQALGLGWILWNYLSNHKWT
jgi:hypothetical protein